MKNKRKGIVLLVVLALMVTLVGCTQKDNKEGGEASNEISLAVWAYDSNREFQALVKGFEEAHGAKVNIVDIDADTYTDKVTTMLASGDTTDVLAMKDIGSYVNYANKGQLVDLTDYEKGLTDEQKANYGLALNSYRLEDDNIYALPYRKDTYVIFYNKTLFDKAGVEYPTGAMTWDEFQVLAEKLTMGENEAEKTYGAYNHSWNGLVQAMSANQTGNDLLDGEYGFMAEYYEMYRDMAEKGHIMDYGTIKSTKTTYSSVFETEKTAMMMMGSFYMSRILLAKEEGNSSVEWGMVAAPQRDKNEVVTYGGPTGMAVSKNAANPELARKFVEYASGEEGAKVAAGIGVTPAYTNDEIIDIIFAIEGMPQDEVSKQALRPDSNGLEYGARATTAEIMKILGEEHDLIMIGDVSVADGIASMEKRVAEVLK